MFLNKKIIVVVPAHNEEILISKVVKTMPDFIDHIVIIDDCSPDRTSEVVKSLIPVEPRLTLIRHEINQGVGGAIATGYEFARDNGYDVAVVMAGDAQMDPNDLPALLTPVALDETDYSKGNRLISGEAFKKIPKVRYFGNAVLSLLTKIASGYWHIADSQTGYTAINAKALKAIDWKKMYKRYGQPNDLLVQLNINNLRVRDVMVEPVYNIGEKSGIKIRKVMFTISWLLLKLFVFRLKEKYIIRDFHPLIFFYVFGIFLLSLCVPLGLRFSYYWYQYNLTPNVNFMALMLCAVMGVQFILFAMWFDMESNKKLY